MPPAYSGFFVDDVSGVSWITGPPNCCFIEPTRKS
jgi:hypothetical protein